MPRQPKPGQIRWNRNPYGLFLYFTAGYKKRSARTDTIMKTQDSKSGRHKEADLFLKKHRNEIRVFAEVGAANPMGAPTAFNAKKALGEKATVYAVDVARLPKKFNLKNEVKPLLHSIVKRPLPFRCDAIRFTNVSIHLTESERRRALVNIWKSLRDGGYLLGADVWKFALKKTGRGFKFVERFSSEF